MLSRKHEEKKFIGEISPETEIDLIMLFLTRDHGGSFKKRIKLDGYIDKPEYRLTIDNYDSPIGKYDGKPISIYGGLCEDIFDVNRKFVEEYWKDNDEMLKTDPSKLDQWDRQTWERRKFHSVATSRDELLLRATAEGLI